MDGWTTLGECAALVVRDARSRMEEKSDERAQRSASALVAVACDPEGSGASGEEDAGLSQGFEDHAACPSERGGTSRTVTPSRVVATNDAARASERARASSSGKRA